MTGKEEFEPLDDLFRKTFQDLPTTPTASGWDTPSPRVWQRVQGQIAPPNAGWSSQTWTLLAALVVVLGTGLYFAYGKSQPIPRPAPAPMEQPVLHPPAVASPPEVLPTAPAGKPAVQPATKVRPGATVAPSNPAVNSSTPRGTDRGKVEATPLPGTKPESPNSTMREKSKNGQEN